MNEGGVQIDNGGLSYGPISTPHSHALYTTLLTSALLATAGNAMPRTTKRVDTKCAKQKAKKRARNKHR